MTTIGTSVGGTATDAGAAERQQKLIVAARSVRTHVSGGDAPRLLLIVGGVLIPLGFVALFLGWMGTSHSPYPVEQFPYLISGGLLGLALVFAGGFLYFGYWLTQLVTSVRRDTVANREVLERIEALLRGDGGATVAPAAIAAAPALAAPTVTARAKRGQQYLATKTGSMFHRPDCTIVSGRPKSKHAR